MHIRSGQLKERNSSALRPGTIPGFCQLVLGRKWQPLLEHRTLALTAHTVASGGCIVDLGGEKLYFGPLGCSGRPCMIIGWVLPRLAAAMSRFELQGGLERPRWLCGFMPRPLITTFSAQALPTSQL
jgi:hypothetical protein